MKIVLLTLLSTFLIQSGYFLWKIAADELPRIGQVRFLVALKSYLCNWKWLLGLLFANLGWILFIMATQIGAISVIQPLMNVGDLLLVFLAVVLLHERLATMEWFGLLLTVAGAVSISLEARVLEPAAIDWTRVVVFMAIALGVLAGLIVLGRRRRQAEVFLGIAVGIGFGVAAVLTKLMTSSLTLSGQDLNFVTGVCNWIFPLVIASNVAGIILLQMAFQSGRAAVIIPVEISVVSGVAVLAGILLFSEVVSISCLFSILAIVSGTALLEYSARQKHPRLTL